MCFTIICFSLSLFINISLFPSQLSKSKFYFVIFLVSYPTFPLLAKLHLELSFVLTVEVTSLNLQESCTKFFQTLFIYIYFVVYICSIKIKLKEQFFFYPPKCLKKKDTHLSPTRNEIHMNMNVNSYIYIYYKI